LNLTTGGTERKLASAAGPRLARAEKLVYLFPDGFDAKEFVAGQLNGRRIFEYRDAKPANEATGEPATLYGDLRGQEFAIEVRARSATIAAERFEVRRDVLLAVKEFVERT